MRVFSGSAPGNISNGCPDSSGYRGGDIKCPPVVVSGRSAKDRRDGDNEAVVQLQQQYLQDKFCALQI
jgi:hypothetical protein